MTAVLGFALVDGAPREAREFVGVPAKDRPAAVCPCCGDAVVWKAGDVKTPHVAHASGATCPANNPETAEHLNAKGILARRLSEGVRLWIRVRCAVCRSGVRALWSVPAWHRVEVEYRVGTRRPDVVLLAEDGSIVAAVEVFHTHAVDAEKAAAFAWRGVRWIETRAEEVTRWARSASSADSTRRALHVWSGDLLSISVRCPRCPL